MTPMRLLRSLLPCLIVAIAVTGCGSSGDDETRLDPKRLEKSIEEGIQDQLGVTMELICPDGVMGRKGDTFTCDATIEDGDGEFDVKVTQKDDDGNVDWDVDALPTGPIEESVAGEIFSQRAIKVTLDCPSAVPLEEGYEFTCEAEDSEGRTQDVFATVKDDEGNVSWRT
jgi:hypothetical protein